MKKSIFLCFILFFCALRAGAAAITLAACEEAALKNSPDIKTLSAQAAAAEQTYKNVSSSLYPVINFEANGSYVTEVPKLNLGPETFKFGDNRSYSLGPVLYYTLFDYGARADAGKSAKSAYEAAQAQLDWGRKSVLLSVRLAYFKLTADLENMFLLAGQLEVARRQSSDVRAAFNAGAKSDLDVYTADKQVLSLLSQINAARAATAADLRDLFEFTVDDFGVNPSYPLDARLANTAGLEPASVLLSVDSVDAALENFDVYNYFNFDAEGPKLLAQDKMIEYYNRVAASYKSSLWPKVALKAGAYWEYPNGPLREDVFLGRGALSVVVPLFEGSRARSKAEEQKRYAAAASAQKEQVYNNLKKIFDGAKDRLNSIKTEKKLAERIIENNKRAVDLTYSAYKAGNVTFLEVDAADNKLTEGKINLVGLKIENLTKLAVVASLGK
ncbi:MAG: TolC family protein [Elusimicrobium sp.]|jgi:outer membrane protein|nr:TolC family protein [Elusimicrobium sp.]